jgi:hypothetical protein
MIRFTCKGSSRVVKITINYPTNKIMKPHKPFKIGLALVAYYFTAASSNAATVSIGNHSFEDATNTSWQLSSNGSTPTNPVRSNTSTSGKHDTPPDGTDWAHHSNGGSNHDIYQVLGATLAANTTYTLTVDVGDRSDHSPGTPLLRLGTVSDTDDGTTGDLIANDFYGESLLTGMIVANTTPFNNETGDPGNTTDGWETWITTFTTGASPTGLGDALRVELENTGGVQAVFDNVRLDASAVPEPSTTALIGLGGLALILRRRK